VVHIDRHLEGQIASGLKTSPVTTILGPRQCGKSTLARQFLRQQDQSIYLDLEKPSDLAKLSDPETFFSLNQDKLICLDEIQRRPDLFNVIKSHVDKFQRNSQFLITGSATPQLLQQSDETLAGRIHLNELTPFIYTELHEHVKMEDHIARGGFPRSVFAQSMAESFKWRQDFIQTFLERDIGQFGLNVPVVLVRRLWRMLAHLHGELLNYLKLGNALGVSSPTIKKYVDLLAGTFMIRLLEPIQVDLKKRIVKSPKVYIRDSGVLQALLGIENYNDLLGHPVAGTTWEGYVIENLTQLFPFDISFFRTSQGAEIDLVIRKGKHIVAIECKATSAPQLTQGFHIACHDIKATHKMVIAPVTSSWTIEKDIEIHSLENAIQRLYEIF
jgi:predicted AAA+ superfamily ATPase